MGNFIFTGSLFCCLIVVYILLFGKKDYRSFSDKILAVLFLSYAYCTAAYLLITSGWLVYLPYTYKTAQPINYLIPPLAYIYVRSILKNEKSFYINDIIHFVPFVFFTINYLPFYFLNSLDKIYIVKNVINDISLTFSKQDGLFPETLQVFRPIQSFIYIFLQWRLIILFENKNQQLLKNVHTVHVVSWLKKFTISISFTVISFVFFVIMLIYGLNNQLNISQIVFYSSIAVALSLFYLSSYLIVNPSVLIGMPYLNYKPDINIHINSSANPKYEKEVKLILDFLEEKKPYLKKSLSINEVSIELDIPLKMLSFIINQHFKVNFNDFVNQYRIRTIVDRIKNGDLDTYTLTTLFEESGFSNKTTFLSAFKKVHHLTPKEFIKTITPITRK